MPLDYKWMKRTRIDDSRRFTVVINLVKLLNNFNYTVPQSDLYFCFVIYFSCKSKCAFRSIQIWFWCVQLLWWSNAVRNSLALSFSIFQSVWVINPSSVLILCLRAFHSRPFTRIRYSYQFVIVVGFFSVRWICASIVFSID